MNLLSRPILASALPSGDAFEKIRHPHQASTIPISHEAFQKICDLSNCSILSKMSAPAMTAQSGHSESFHDVTAMRMAMTASNTSKYSNGQLVATKIRNKEFGFPSEESLAEYILGLIHKQNGRCAISGIELQYDDHKTDPELHCSLDRIDSNGHYEPGNLQVVCRFINRWKSASSDVEFRRLVKLLRQNEPALVRNRRIRR
ncbi:MAG: hypothetical protein KGO02_25985 [Alphaproteobacteria bacterium]|nr:hypothetical protein [Alphaproteobacteria bacterium]